MDAPQAIKMASHRRTKRTMRLYFNDDQVMFQRRRGYVSTTIRLCFNNDEDKFQRR